MERFKYYQSGVSLVEILIALAISLVLVGVASYSYIASKGTFRSTDEQTQIYEDGRFALELLGQNIRSAGFMVSVDYPVDQIQKFTDIFPSDTAVVDVRALRGCAGGVDASHNCLVTPTPGQPSALSVTYFTDNPDAIGNASGKTNDELGLGVDCVGKKANQAATPTTPPPPATRRYFVTNLFFISQTNYVLDGQNKVLYELSCLGSGGTGIAPQTPQSLVKGVRDLQFLYGVDSSGNDEAVTRYFTADQVEAQNFWESVINVRVCVLMETIKGGVTSGPSTYQDCDGVTQNVAAGVLRRAFTSTYNLRNRVRR